MVGREQEILDKMIDVFKKYIDPKTIYLFGSRSKGTHRKGSDFDLAVSGLKPEQEIQRNIQEAMEKFTGLYKADIVYLESVEGDFRDLILQQGKIIYEKRI